MGLQVETKKDGNILIISASGPLDAHHAPDFEKQATQFVSAENGNLIVNLSKVDHIASAGFGALMPVKNIQDEKGLKMVLCGMNDNVKKVFKLLGFNNILKEYSSVDEAKKAI